MGDQTGDAKRLVWGVADEERFQGDLDEKVRRMVVVSLTVRCVTGTSDILMLLLL